MKTAFFALGLLIGATTLADAAPECRWNGYNWICETLEQEYWNRAQEHWDRDQEHQRYHEQRREHREHRDYWEGRR